MNPHLESLVRVIAQAMVDDFLEEMKTSPRAIERRDQEEAPEKVAEAYTK